MKFNSQRRFAMAAAAVLCLSIGVAACGDDDDDSGDSGGDADRVAVLLPDSKSSDRWETQDRPLLEAAFKDAGVPVTISNAEGDKSTQQQQAEQAITNGAKVILLVNLDSGSGAAIQADAASKDVKTIDYDRLTLNGQADYYVSFDNVEVGKLQGQGLVDCLTEKKTQNPQIAVLNGSPTDNNATLFKQGYDSVLNPKFKAGDYKEIDDQSVPDWDNQKALTIFEQMLQANDNKVDGVLAANDGLGNAAISAIKQRDLPQVPVTGQDATVEGLQNILAGDQCMTVYKAIKQEADAASQLAIALAKGQDPPEDLVNGESDDGKRQVPSVLLKPVTVTADNINDTVIQDEFVDPKDLCAGKFAKPCADAGIEAAN